MCNKFVAAKKKSATFIKTATHVRCFSKKKVERNKEELITLLRYQIQIKLLQ